MSTPPDARIACAVCGAPIATCTVAGLHGMIRERSALAAIRLHGPAQPAKRRFTPRDMTGQAY